MAVKIIDGIKFKTPYTFRNLIIGKTYKLFFKKIKHNFSGDYQLISMPENFISLLHMGKSDKFVFSNGEEIINLYVKHHSSKTNLVTTFGNTNAQHDVSIWEKVD